MSFRATKETAADTTRLSKSAPEVSEKWRIEPNYFDFSQKQCAPYHDTSVAW